MIKLIRKSAQGKGLRQVLTPSPGLVLRNKEGHEDPSARREAVGFLRKVRELIVRLAREAEFTAYVNQLRAAHKPKRNFMKLLDRERL